MNRLILPVLFVLIAGIVAYYGAGGIINGSDNLLAGLILKESGQGIRALRAEEKKLNTAIENARDLLKKSDELKKEREAMPQEKLERLNKFLPNTVDTVELVVDLNNIAENHGMSVRNVRVNEGKDKNLATSDSAATFSQNVNRNENIGELEISFSVKGPYSSFLGFLSDLADSLRVVDVGSLSFSTEDKDFSQYDVKLKTYWVK